jgi:hypothetical protein
MAISFKADKEYGYSLLPLFGVSTSMVAQAKAAGVLVDQSSPGTFVVKYGETTYGSVTVKGSAISLAKSKTLGPASKEALKYQFESAIEKALKASGSVQVTFESVVEAMESPAPHNPIKTVKNPLKGLSPSVPYTSSGKFSKQSPVPLKEAKHVYEATCGTTAGSVYFVLAVIDGMNISARVQGQKLSMRAEGDKMFSYKSQLEEMGMDMKGSYSSGHYDVSSTGLMIKTLGAMVGSVGFGVVKEVADLQKFLGGQ